VKRDQEAASLDMMILFIRY